MTTTTPLLSHDAALQLAMKHQLIGRVWPRERDDFEDADDVASDPLPPSDWWQMDLATQDAATGRQQT